MKISNKVSDKEFLMASILSYFNFKEKEKGKNIFEALAECNFIGIKKVHFKLISNDTYPIFLKYFELELKKWKIFEIDDRRMTSKDLTKSQNNIKTGFYAISFIEERSGNVILTFRGTEVMPLEEAYKDFIENDFILGIGKKPKQYYDAVEFFEKHIKNSSLNIENIMISGHSLGGGIAQLIALYSNKEYGHIPKTCTWNALGLNKNKIITIQDFLDFYKIIDESHELDNTVIKELKLFKEIYYQSLNSSLEQQIENLESVYNKTLKLQMLINLTAAKIGKTSEEKQQIKDKLIKVLFKDKNINDKYQNARKFIRELKKGVSYLSSVINYAHSKDFTSKFFSHLGYSYEVDTENYIKNRDEVNLVMKIFDKNSSAIDYHFENVFIPYIKEHGENKDYITNEVCKNYVISAARKFIYEEEGFDSEILAFYYSNEKLDDKNWLEIKNLLLEGISKSKVSINYKNKILIKITGLDENEFKDFWYKLKIKMPSPYKKIDVYDAIIY